jgi:lipoprotein-releasing system permease protein
MLDLNVEIIIGLMSLISVINMTSALLILILERRAMVGMLKAIGMANSQVMRMFFWQAVRILGRGFWIGNAIGFALIFVQSQTGWVRLDPQAYYVEVVPVHVDLGFIAGMELLTFAVCALMMWLPALASTRILPAEALKLKN